MAHTPGPWDAGGLTVYDTCMDGVASCHSAEDARLIAAAPDMFEALQKIETAALGGFLTPELCAEIVKAALSKVTGT